MDRLKRLVAASEHLKRIAQYLPKVGNRIERLKKHLYELNEIEKKLSIKEASYRSPELLQHFYTQADITISILNGVMRDLSIGNLTLDEQRVVLQQDMSLSKIIKKLNDYHKECLNKKLFFHDITPQALRDKINKLVEFKRNLRPYLRRHD